MVLRIGHKVDFQTKYEIIVLENLWMSADKMKVQVLILFISNYSDKHKKADTFKRWVPTINLSWRAKVDWTYSPDYWYVMTTLYTKYEMD